MKKNTTYMLLVLLLVTSWSCTGFLDIDKEGEMSASGIDYTKRDNMFLSVSNAYASMRSGNAHGMPYFGMLEITSDDAYKGSEPNDEANMILMENLTYDATCTTINDYWVGHFGIVSAANNSMFTLPNFLPIVRSEQDKQDYNNMIAESRFIRAYAYFNLVRAFGGVPIIDSLMTAEQLAQQPRASRDDVYAFIHRDLNYAIAHLAPSYSKDWAGRATQYTAIALKAKTYMHQAQWDVSLWDSVAHYTDLIIASGKYDLLPSLYDVFRPDGENSKESLFEIQASSLGKTTGEAPYIEGYAYYQGPRYNKPSNMQGWGLKVPSDSLIAFFNRRGDIERTKATIMARGTKTIEGDSIITKCFNPYYNMKVYTPSSYNKWSYNGYGFDYNIRIIRYADVLLMNAEAKARRGGDAATPFNKVRSRAGLVDIGAPTLQDVLDERRAELALEENRFYDLVRTGQAASVLGSKFKVGTHELFPIPQRQHDLNPRLTQNPGYTAF